MAHRNKKYTTEELISKLEIIWPDLHERFETRSISYGKNNESKIEIICRKHGPFLARPSTLFKKHGCRKCYDEVAGSYRKCTQKEFLDKVKSRIGDIYNLSEFVYINALTKGKASCREHGPWLITPNNLLRGRKCPRCKSSTGETAIRKYLKSKGIEFEEQKKFPTCRYKNQLSYDFYIPKIKLLVEFNGQQHYSGKEWWGGKSNLKVVRKRDTLKKVWAKENGYGLLVISHTHLNSLDKILDLALKRPRP